MELNEARELRQHLEKIESSMQNIVQLWETLPPQEELEDLLRTVQSVEASMQNIIDQAKLLPDLTE